MGPHAPHPRLTVQKSPCQIGLSWVSFPEEQIPCAFEAIYSKKNRIKEPLYFGVRLAKVSKVDREYHLQRPGFLHVICVFLWYKASYFVKNWMLPMFKNPKIKRGLTVNLVLKPF